MQALERAGITVGAKALQTNPRNLLPPHDAYAAASRVAQFTSPPYSEIAKLVLKVSLNLGANLSLSLFGVAQGTRTIGGSLAAERTALTALGVSGSGFAFPTNGSGSPDSKANPSAVVQLLTAMSKGANAVPYHAALPILGVDGSLAGTGRSLPAKGHVFAKTGTTLEAGALKAQVLAGYIDAKSGRKLAFALFVNDGGQIKAIADVSEVFDDEAAITNAIYVNN
jgi:D-alanyl-D-alanine carboxypeptidase/D-alanyl-D-alanine-endopeptidase (penicillin-binding protein 4)